MSILLSFTAVVNTPNIHYMTSVNLQVTINREKFDSQESEKHNDSASYENHSEK